MVLERANAEIKPIIEQLGYEVVEIAYKKLDGNDNLIFFIYKKEGIMIEDCEKVNDAISPILDELDITEGKEYTLSVSSPGLDREIVSNDDLRRNLDTEIEIFLKKFIGKNSKIVGILKSYNEDTITVLSKDKEIVVEKNNIKKMQPYIRF